MKIQLLKPFAILFALTTPIFAFSQACQPDGQYSGLTGLHPDVNVNLTQATAGQSYSQTMTIVVPQDTTVNFPGVGVVNLTMNNRRLDAIQGLPQGFSYACNPSNCSFPGNSLGCIIITGNPTIGQAGTYPLN